MNDILKLIRICEENLFILEGKINKADIENARNEYDDLNRCQNCGLKYCECKGE
jgi:hypothetical protein